MRATPWRGDAAALARRVPARVAALRDAGARVKAKIGKPVSAADRAALTAALGGAMPGSLAAILRVCDGFDVQWERDGVGVTCTWLSAKASVKEARRAAKRGDGPRGLVPLLRQYDGCLVALDTRVTRAGEFPVVFLDRLADAPRGVAGNAGAFLKELLAAAFTHAQIPDRANAPAAALGKKLARRA